MTEIKHTYTVRPRKDKRGVDLISDALPFGRLWYDETDAIANAIVYAKFCSRSHDVVIRSGGYELATNARGQELNGDFTRPMSIWMSAVNQVPPLCTISSRSLLMRKSFLRKRVNLPIRTEPDFL